MRILVDMDEVITDLEGKLVEIWDSRHPDVQLFPTGIRTSFYIGGGLDQENAADVFRIIHEKGFFSSLKPKPGSLEALYKMIEMGHEVFIVTSAGINYPNAASEKYQWIEQNMFQEMLSHLVITPSKYLVNGDVLIDDRPEIHREEEATWEHVLFDTTYNRNDTKKRRLSWDNWQEVLDL